MRVVCIVSNVKTVVTRTCEKMITFASPMICCRSPLRSVANWGPAVLETTFWYEGGDDVFVVILGIVFT